MLTLYDIHNVDRRDGDSACIPFNMDVVYPIVLFPETMNAKAMIPRIVATVAMHAVQENSVINVNLEVNIQHSGPFEFT